MIANYRIYAYIGYISPDNWSFTVLVNTVHSQVYEYIINIFAHPKFNTTFMKVIAILP